MKWLQRVFYLTVCLILIAFCVHAQESMNVNLQGRWAFGPINKSTTAPIGGDNYLLMGDGGFLEIWDIFTDPAIPLALSGGNDGRLALPEQLEAIAVLGDYAYVAVDQSGLLIIDVSAPDTPALAGTHDTGGRALDVDVMEWGDLNDVFY